MGIKWEPTVNITTLVAILGVVGGGLAIYVDNVKTNSHQDDLIAALTSSVKALSETVSGIGSQVSTINSFVATATQQMKSLDDRQDRFSDFARTVSDKLSGLSVGIAEIKGRLGVVTPEPPPPPKLLRGG